MKQKLMTQALKNTLNKYPIHSQDGKGKQAKVLAHFFLGSHDWYVLEGEERDGDYLFFGIVDFHDGYTPEYGYFNLSDFERTYRMPISVNGRIKLTEVNVERDIYWDTQTVEDAHIFRVE